MTAEHAISRLAVKPEARKKARLLAGLWDCKISEAVERALDLALEVAQKEKGVFLVK
jgi:hypothetical protein